MPLTHTSRHTHSLINHASCGFSIHMDQTNGCITLPVSDALQTSSRLTAFVIRFITRGSKALETEHTWRRRHYQEDGSSPVSMNPDLRMYWTHSHDGLQSYNTVVFIRQQSPADQCIPACFHLLRFVLTNPVARMWTTQSTGCVEWQIIYASLVFMEMKSSLEQQPQMPRRASLSNPSPPPHCSFHVCFPKCASVCAVPYESAL